MEKTISITLNGEIFNIEEDAYRELEKYFNSIKSHYNEADGSEIMADIEASVAAKFAGKISGKKKLINSQDVQEIIEIMGTVDEFDADEEAAGKKGGQAEESGFSPNEKAKKLYRDSDDVIIAGVCSGLAAYFGIDPIIIRIIFVVLFFVQGLGILVYIILWIMMPRAENSWQKMEMRGGEINLKRIEQAVKEKSEVAREKGAEAYNQLKNKNWSTAYKIFNLPVKLIEISVRFIKKVVSKIWPITLFLIGTLCLLIAFFTIIALTISAGIFTFNLSSAYIVSDIPLTEIIRAPMYYVGIIAVYLTALIPIIFLFMLGWTILSRKSAFRLIPVSLMAIIWIAAISGAVVAALDLTPRVKEQMALRAAEVADVRNYDYQDFRKIYLGGNVDAVISRGDAFSLSFSGAGKDLERLDFQIEDGQLQITQRRRDLSGKICLLCFDERVKAEITLPELDSYVGINSSTAEIKGFDKDIYISLGESADAEMQLNRQNLTCSLSGVSSTLTLGGQGNRLECRLDGRAKLKSEELAADQLDLDMSIWSSAQLAGSIRALQAELDGYAKLSAYECKSEQIAINAKGNAHAQIYPTLSLKALAHDNSQILFKGTPKERTVQALGNGEIKAAGIMELDDLGNSEAYLQIEAEPDVYSPLMSSAQGIKLSPKLSGNEDAAIFRWETNDGYLVKDWTQADQTQRSLTTANQTVYWAYGGDKTGENGPVMIYLKTLDDDLNTLNTAELEIVREPGDGMTFRVQAAE